MTLVLTVLTGLIYPGVVTGLCQMLFPNRANGSIIYKDRTKLHQA
jgi:potassium-transporting ATPase KdpC subunit